MNLLLALLLAAPAAADGPDSLTVGGRERWWIERAPSGAKGPLPVVLVLHGGGGDPGNAERMSGMTALAEKEGFIAVYPAGTGRFKKRLLTWNAGNCCGKAMKEGVDDAAFLAALIKRLIAERKADRDRIYMTGMSNGGMMTHRFACERADLVAAIAPVAGQLNVETCAPSRPVPVLMIHGKADEHAPYAGGTGKKSFESRVDRSVDESAAIWRKAGSEVVVLAHDAGHVWPGGKPGRRFGNVDQPPAKPDASAEMWEFFRKRVRN